MHEMSRMWRVVSPIGQRSLHHSGEMLSVHDMSRMWRVVSPRSARVAHWRRESSTLAPTSPEPSEPDDADAETETVQVEYRGKIMRVNKGSLLRSALLRNGASPHNDKAMYVNCRSVANVQI